MARQKGKGYFKGKKRQRGGYLKSKKRQRGGGELTDKMSHKILNEFSKAARYGKKLAKSTGAKVRRKFQKIQKGGFVRPRPHNSFFPERYYMR